MRWICFNPGHGDAGRVHRRIGECYRRTGRWPQAVAAFRQAASSASTERERGEARLSAAATQMVAGHHSAAELDLLRLATFSPVDGIRADANLLLCACYVYQHEWQKAREAIAAGAADEIAGLLEEGERLPAKSPAAAKWMSTALPGTGQMYAGEWRDGIHALLVNGAAVFLLVDGLLDRRYGDVLLVNGALLERFYRGNRLNAADAAERYNRRVGNEHARRVLRRMENM